MGLDWQERIGLSRKKRVDVMAIRKYSLSCSRGKRDPVF